MSLFSKITRTPLHFGPDTAADKGAGLPQALANIASASPFLAGNLQKHGGWVCDHFDQPDPICDLIAPLAGDDPGKELRLRKAKLAGLVAAGELTGAAPLMVATKLLTRFADFAVHAAFDHHISKLQTTGKLPENTGLFVLAMGKMGAFELNYSSDIDLIVMFDDTRHSPDDVPNIRMVLNRVTRAVSKTLSELTADGYVFRTDLRLRPDPSVTPVCVPVSQALAYYESLGRTWERAAFIKARVCAGDMAAGDAFLNQLTPFVWRRHLDFAAIQDAHDLVQKIRAANPAVQKINLPGHDLKLGRGGIREIEFFTQTRQLIAGGRDPSLRGRGTLAALQALHTAGWVKDTELETLSTAYVTLRHGEHAVQMLRDVQTASVPVSPGGIEQVAALLGQTPGEFEREILNALHNVQAITESFFDKDDTPSHPVPSVDLQTRMARWNGFRAFRTERALRLFEEIAPRLDDALSTAADPDDAWAKFEVFLENLPAGVQLFSLFYANPKLIELVAEIVCTSPDLATHLARNTVVLDAVLGGGFFDALPGQAAYETALRGALNFDDDYEADLDRARIWQKEQHFRIGVHFLRAQVGVGDVGHAYATLGRAVVRVMLDLVQHHFARKHGIIAGSAVALVSMGSLATGRMTANSDLDLLLIFQADDDAMSDGRRSLDTRVYFSRFTQMLISALSAPTAQGHLYEVDMRLRPSGRAGPVALRYESFASYQMDEAWTWEHLALTQARPIVGDNLLCQRISDCIAQVLTAKSGWAQVYDGWVFMLDKLDEITGSATQNPKTGPGGMQRAELLCQAACLTAGQGLASTTHALGLAVQAGVLDQSDADALAAAWQEMANIRQCLALLNPGDAEFTVQGDAGWNFMARHCGISTQAGLDRALQSHRDTVADIEHKVRHGHNTG